MSARLRLEAATERDLAAVDLNRLSGKLLEMVVKDLRVFLFLIRGEGEHRLNHMELLLLGC